ncbi:PolC-type DNA polymerase III [Halopseudomonas phragmitis]|uniref:DNA polymerase III subunit epsilon n=2 Tax=Pseudomonadaceae TaxID=135621 RepID=A0A1V0B731_9GAMM|nr:MULTISPECIES: 3'-5' exonuclease [Pseudomonadaceae]AQZ95746.1 DNA polymerase III subunit epsilon [Halopseudomonas phragmitis]PAU88666.1 3'-5' exonuclease [Pseudomonas sp. WN033]RHW21411.1 3'-5' exonuclease [Pseudomonas jilinensis]
MSPLAWFPRLRPCQLSPEQHARREALPPPQPLDDTPLSQTRLVVVDLETSGLNVQRDQILSIGAVVIEQGAIDMGSQYECTLYRANHQVTESVLIHGIAPSEIEQGMEAEDALLDFVEFAGESVFLAFHAAFDQRMLSRGLRQDLGYRLSHKFIDVAELAPMLCPEARVGRGGLDEWLDYFGLSISQRHNAAADALATAELTLILLSKARAKGINTLAQLNTCLGHWRRLRQARSASM